MNIYKYTFPVMCPSQNQFVIYHLEIETDTMIMVEDIIAECGAFTEAFHEDIAKHLVNKFGGRQTLEANHHGVDIVTSSNSHIKSHKPKTPRPSPNYGPDHWSYGMSEV